jgi:uncharacterized protein YmfQ (DUF2313 family)
MDSERDRHVRRSGDDYSHSFLSLLPQGPAWPRALDSALVRAVFGLCNYWGFVDSRAGDLLEIESDPRTTVELLGDWEKAWGLPDDCLPSASDIAARQRLLVLMMTWMGSQSREYFIELANWLGYDIFIKEFAPFMAGISQVGDTRTPPPSNDTVFDSGTALDRQNHRWYIGPAEQRFVWQVNVGQIGLYWFRAGSGQAGVDHHLEFAVPTEIICLLDRWKPAHTTIIPDFSDLTNGGPMQGTP